MSRKQEDIVKELTDKEILFHLYLTQLLLLVISLIIGFFLFENMSSFLSIWKVKQYEILIFGGGTAIIVIIFDIMMMKLLPKSMYDDGGINDRIFQKRSIPHIFLLCLIISVTEEILFRGILQTHFGLYIASIVFALLHVRYLKKWVLLVSVILISFLLGIVYEITNNLWVTIFAHFFIDFVSATKIRIDYLSKDKR